MQPHNNRTRRASRRGFTLIEILMVIGIIGILVGLLVPAVNMALNSVKKRAIAMEVSTLASAVDKYKEKYGDYPPDGSSFQVFRRHCLKVWPQIANSEITDVVSVVKNNQLLPPGVAEFRVMDPTEALVFFLGGFSDDPVHPFTGAGGPIQIVSRDSSGDPTLAQYNVDRTGPLYEFKQNQLTLEVVEIGGVGYTISNDEVLYALSGGNDIMPAYRIAGKNAPIVYFDSRTYAADGYVSYFALNGGQDGFARPYKSLDRNTSVMWSAATADRHYRYANEKSFQIVSAGLDDNFGNFLDPLEYGTAFYAYPSGQYLDITWNPTDSVPGKTPIGYRPPPVEWRIPAGRAERQFDSFPAAQLDNATNFSEGVLEDSMDN